jgi:hypothetical protein
LACFGRDRPLYCFCYALVSLYLVSYLVLVCLLGTSVRPLPMVCWPLVIIFQSRLVLSLLVPAENPFRISRDHVQIPLFCPLVFKLFGHCGPPALALLLSHYYHDYIIYFIASLDWGRRVVRRSGSFDGFVEVSFKRILGPGRHRP